MKGLAQHPFLSPPSGTEEEEEEEEDMEDVQEEEDEVEEEEPNGHIPRPAWTQDKSAFKQVGYFMILFLSLFWPLRFVQCCTMTLQHSRNIVGDARFEPQKSGALHS